MNVSSSKRNLVIKPAEYTDLNDIVSLHVASWRENYVNNLSPDFLQSDDVFENRFAVWQERLSESGRLSHNQCVAIASVNNTFAGFICVYLNKHEQLGTLIDNLHVAANARGFGVATALMNYGACWMEQQKCESPIYLEVYADNERAQRFYAHIGGQLTTDRPFSVDAPDGGNALSYHMVWDSPSVLKEKTADGLQAAYLRLGVNR